MVMVPGILQLILDFLMQNFQYSIQFVEFWMFVSNSQMLFPRDRMTILHSNGHVLGFYPQTEKL